MYIPTYLFGFCLYNSNSVGCQVCSGDCAEFGIHLNAASIFLRLGASDRTAGIYIEQRIAW